MTFPFTQLLANSLIIGSVYGLVAAGFSLIYGTNRFMHFAHGAAVVAGGYFCFLFFTLLHIQFSFAVVLTILCSALLGLLMHVFLYNPLRMRGSSNVILLLASVALLILLENVILLFFGADVKSVGLLPVEKGLELFGAIVTPLQFVIIGVSVCLFVTLWVFMNYTRLGSCLRAVADNPELARVMGIPAKRLMAVSFVIGSVLAGVAGILIALEQNLEPSMGTNLMVKGFSGAVIGGVTSVPASVLGSYLVGVAENFGIWWIPSGWRDAITFTLLFLFLLYRPQGLLGRTTEARS